MEKDVLESMPPAQRTSYEMSRRKAIGIAAKLGLGGAAAAMGVGIGSTSVREALAAGGLPQKDYKITFVNHVTTNPFFTPTIYGIEDACAFLGCSYQWTGSETATVTEMVSAMQTAIADKVDGIAVCLVDPQFSARLRRPEPL
jgi:simple sugar transport system substrate-binding protein